MTKIEVTEVSIDFDLQPRTTIAKSVVEEYAEAMSTDARADGHHRFHAARKVGWGKEGTRQLKRGLFCSSCYAIQPTEIIDIKEVPYSEWLGSEAV